MTNQELNTKLYKKMFAEQEQFKQSLCEMPAEEILNHAYEYTNRQDILLSLEYNDLTDAQCKALLKSPTPLADVFRELEKMETGHMDDIQCCIESRADTVIRREKARDAR